jgi:hypothetical protein
MKLKTGENLPVDTAKLLIANGFDAWTIHDEGLTDCYKNNEAG